MNTIIAFLWLLTTFLNFRFRKYHSLVSSPRSEESNILSLKSAFGVILTTCAVCALITESSTGLTSPPPVSSGDLFNCTKCCTRCPCPRGCGTGAGSGAVVDSPSRTGSVSYAFSDDGGWLTLPSSSGKICLTPNAADRVLLFVRRVRLL